VHEAAPGLDVARLARARARVRARARARVRLDVARLVRVRARVRVRVRVRVRARVRLDVARRVPRQRAPSELRQEVAQARPDVHPQAAIPG